MGIAFSWSKLLKVDAIGDDAGRDAQPVIIQHSECRLGWRGYIRATIIKPHQVRICHRTEMFANKRVSSQRTTDVDRQVMIGGNGRLA